jgi:hypothetical protein
MVCAPFLSLWGMVVPVDIIAIIVMGTDEPTDSSVML